MSHMVIYRGSDGKPGYHQTDDIHDAVGFVEQMRNDQGVEHARIFRLEEVVFQYKPYYRVELAESGFGELGGGADTATGRDPGNGSTNGTASLDLTADTNGGGTESTDGGNSPSDEQTPATAGSTPSSSDVAAPTSDDGGGSKRGLFGR